MSRLSCSLPPIVIAASLTIMMEDVRNNYEAWSKEGERQAAGRSDESELERITTARTVELRCGHPLRALSFSVCCCRHRGRIRALCQTYHIHRETLRDLPCTACMYACTRHVDTSQRHRSSVQLGIRHSLSSVHVCVFSRPYLLPCQASSLPPTPYSANPS